MSMDLTVDIGTYTLTVAWYWIMTLAIIGITTGAGLYHKKAEPVWWGWVMGLVLVCLHSYIEPVLFGWMSYGQSNIYIYWLLVAMALMFLIQMVVLLSNAIRKGEVWQ